jgi:hypothetical protein
MTAAPIKRALPCRGHVRWPYGMRFVSCIRPPSKGNGVSKMDAYAKLKDRIKSRYPKFSVEVQDLAQLDAAFTRVAGRRDPVEGFHFVRRQFPGAERGLRPLPRFPRPRPPSRRRTFLIQTNVITSLG